VDRVAVREAQVRVDLTVEEVEKAEKGVLVASSKQ
jgi:hypothetical protein